MMSETEGDKHPVSLLEKLHSETALISWLELQRFFAQGSVLKIAPELDLVQTAMWLAEDSSDKLKPYVENGQIAAPSTDQARSWYDNRTELWSVVVAPFVLVQETPAGQEKD